MIGKPFWETRWFSGTPGMREAVHRAFVAVMRGGEVQTEMLLHLPIGDRYFEFAMRPLRNQHGKVLALFRGKSYRIDGHVVDEG